MSAHECPGGGCTERIGSDRLACRNCWFRLPKALRNEIWEAYRNRVGPEGYRRHRNAVQAAVEWYVENT